MSRNPNNCGTCNHMKHNGDNAGWCYMFRDEPNDVCSQHTGRIRVNDSFAKAIALAVMREAEK